MSKSVKAPLHVPHSSNTLPSQSHAPSAIPSPLHTPHSSYSPTQSSLSSQMLSASASTQSFVKHEPVSKSID